ncbi:MAG: helix-hairpin-helix domain-containing protein, partial [Bacteroidales bacterium]|nr:helix-hairpin-helix domain-containing protein [Bacteroidales bacterium]
MRRLAVISLLLLLTAAARAQDVPQSIEDVLEQIQDSESGSASEELLQWYESLLLNPLNINAASRSQLEELRLLSLFQIESLLEYREEYGAILSLSELAAVDGFNRDLVETLQPFISLEETVGGGSGAYSQFRTRLKWKSSQEGLYRYARYLGGAGRFSYGATFESD